MSFFSYKCYILVPVNRMNTEESKNILTSIPGVARDVVVTRSLSKLKFKDVCIYIPISYPSYPSKQGPLT